MHFFKTDNQASGHIPFDGILDEPLLANLNKFVNQVSSVMAIMQWTGLLGGSTYYLTFWNAWPLKLALKQDCDLLHFNRFRKKQVLEVQSVILSSITVQF